MRIVYMGSPSYAIYPLESLLSQPSHQVVAVVSQPARPLGRGRRGDQRIDPPLASFAKKHGLLTLQPAKAREPMFLNKIQELAPDLVITCAYGQILTESFLSIPVKGTINIHPSKLPQYRGATPVQTALLDGLKSTAVTILYTVKALDAGDLILQKDYSIKPDETAGELLDRLFKLSGSLLLEALQKIELKNFVGRSQEPSEVTHSRKINKEDGLVRWSESKEFVYNHYRAYHPWPGSYSFLNKKRVLITKLRMVEDGTPDLPSEESCLPGQAFFLKKDKSIYVKVKDGWVGIEALKLEGKKNLSAQVFWNGLGVSKGSSVQFG